PILIASLLGTTAMAPVALSQESSGQTEAAAQGEGCQALTQLIEEHSDRLQEAWVAEANGVVESGDEVGCTTYHEEASAALAAAGEAGAEADARIVVTQSDPSVSVEQQAPEVTV